MADRRGNSSRKQVGKFVNSEIPLSRAILKYSTAYSMIFFSTTSLLIPSQF